MEPRFLCSRVSKPILLAPNITQTRPFWHRKPLKQFAFIWVSGKHQYIARGIRRLVDPTGLMGISPALGGI